MSRTARSYAVRWLCTGNRAWKRERLSTPATTPGAGSLRIVECRRLQVGNVQGLQIAVRILSLGHRGRNVADDERAYRGPRNPEL